LIVTARGQGTLDTSCGNRDAAVHRHDALLEFGAELMTVGHRRTNLIRHAGIAGDERKQRKRPRLPGSRRGAGRQQSPERDGAKHDGTSV